MNLNAKIQLQELFSNRISFDKTECKLYGHDIAAMPGLLKPLVGDTIPEAVVQPQSEGELVELVNWATKNKVPLTIFLVNGVKLQGVVTWFDNFCVLLRRDGHSQLVYKHAISTIMPGQPIQLADISDAEGSAE